MAMSFFLSTSSSFSVLPIPRKPATVPSVSFPLIKPRRFLPLSRIPPNLPRLSSIPISSCKPPTVGVLSSVATTSRTLLFLLAISLLSLSGVRPPPALACAPPPTQQPQEIEEQDEQQESEESKEQEEGDVKKSEEEVKDKEEDEALMQQGKREDDVNKSAEEVKDKVTDEALMQQGKEEKDVNKSEEEVKDNEKDEALSQQGEAEEEGEVEADDEVKMYSAILSHNPSDVDALKCLLYAKMRRANWDGALRYTRRLREAEPGEVEWRLLEAQLHELRGDLAEAERQFREVLTEDPLHIRALHGLALCMHKRPEGPSAFEMLENALHLAISEKRVPKERDIKILIAQMHVVKGELEVASEKLQKLINEDPRDFRPHLCQGIVYALLDRKDEADVQFDIYRSLVPDEFPDKSFINDIILAARTESNDHVKKEFGSECLWEK